MLFNPPGKYDILLRQDTHVGKGGLGYTILYSHVDTRDSSLLTILAEPGHQYVTREQIYSTPGMHYALRMSAAILSILFNHGSTPYKVSLEDFLEMYNTLKAHPEDLDKANEVESWLRNKIHINEEDKTESPVMSD